MKPDPANYFRWCEKHTRFISQANYFVISLTDEEYDLDIKDKTITLTENGIHHAENSLI